MKSAILLFLLPLFSGVAFAQGGERQRVLSGLMRTYAAEKNLSGSLFVLADGESYSGSAGLADQDTGRVNSEDTLFSIASNSKQFVAAALLKLEEEGRLKMDAPVAPYFPELPAAHFSFDGTPLLIEHLMQNTSGLRSPENDPVLKRKFMREVIEIDEILAGMRDLPLAFAPGSRFEYTDINFIFGGEIVRRVSGMTYSEFLRRHVLGPVLSKDIQVDLKTNGGRVARSYEWKENIRQDFFRLNGFTDGQTNDAFADGNIFATAGGLARWTQALVAGRVLGPDSLRKLFAPSRASVAQKLPYAYAWSIRSCVEGGGAYFHDGGFAGYASRMLVFPDLKTSVIWLSNQPEINESFLAEVLELFSLKVNWDGCEDSLSASGD